MSQIVSTPLASPFSDAHPPRSRALRRVRQAGCALLPASGLNFFGRAIAAEGREVARLALFLAPKGVDLARRVVADTLLLTAAALFAGGFTLGLYGLFSAVPT